jgi:hypothetical protein
MAMVGGNGNGDNKGQWQWRGNGGSKSKNQEGRNKGGVKIKGGRTKRKSFQLHNLGDVFL